MLYVDYVSYRYYRQSYIYKYNTLLRAYTRSWLCCI